MARSALVALAASIALVVAPGLASVAVAASGDGRVDLTDSTTASGAGWTYDDSTDVFTVTGDVTITGTTTTNRVVVASDATVNITLDGASIDVSATVAACAFDMTGATVNLTLAGANTLKSGPTRAGLQAPDGSVLTINAANGTSDKLTATGGIYGAGVGGGNGGAGGNITINGGTVTANGDDAGVGGGNGGAGGNITINGGTVTANGDYGAGIGGGYDGAGGNITINGGTVTANANYGAGIGGGYDGAGGNIVITGGEVTATGGSAIGFRGGGAGIGGGGGGGSRTSSGGSGYITITSGATIQATGGASTGGGGGAGIGSGGSLGTLPIGAVASIIRESGSSVTATGGTGGSTPPRNGAGIGYGGGNSSVSGNENAGQSVTPGSTVTYRTVTVTQATGGTVAAHPSGVTTATSVANGAHQTYMITPDVGYKIASVIVDGGNVGAVPCVTLTNITDDTRTITAIFEELPRWGVSLSGTGTYSFAGAAYGYAEQSPLTVTVTNTGNQSTGALNVALSGTSAGSFTVSNNGVAAGITAANGTATFDIAPNSGLGVGTYTATVTVSGSNGITASFGVSFTVGRGTQKALTINGLGPSYTYGDAAFALSTGGGSGDGEVTFVSNSPAVASVSGNMVTIHQAGSFTITATQAADTNYDAASVTSSPATVVSWATPGVSLTHNSAPTGDPLVLTATVTKVGVGDVPQGSVTFYDGASLLATVALDGFGVATYTIDPLDAASHTYQAQYSGQINKYVMTTSSPVVYEAGKNNQTGLAITPPAGGLTYGDAAFTLSGSGGSGSGEVTYAVPPSNGVIEVTPGGAVTIIGAGTVTVTATKDGDSLFNPATATLDITVDPRDISNVTVDVVDGQIYTGSQLQPVFGVADGIIAINQSDYTNTYGPNINAGTGAGSVILAGQRNYTGTKTVTFNIAKAVQSAPPAVLAGEPSPTAVTLVAVPGAQYSLDGTTWQSSPTFTGLAANTTYQFWVWLPGDANHEPSPNTMVQVTTAKATYPVRDHFGTWNGDGPATSQVGGDLVKFTHLTKDGVTIDAALYTVKPGPVIELSQAYLATLAEGDHTLYAHYTDGVSGPINLTIQTKSTGQGTPTPTPTPTPGTTPTPTPTNRPGHLAITGPTTPVPLLAVGALVLLAAGTHLIQTRRKTTEPTR